MKPSLNRTTVFKLIVHGIELPATFEERENKHKNLSFPTNPQNCITNAILWEKKDNSKLRNVYKHK